MKVTRVIYVAVTAGMLAGSAAPLAAATVADCYEKVLTMCADAMDGAKWYEKVALSVTCSAMLIGCNATINVSK